MRKQHLINTLFISSFSFFGVGRYLAHAFNFSVGYFFSLAPLLAILLLYLLDVLYQKKALPRLHISYVWLLLLALAYAASFLVALRHNQPGMNSINTCTLMFYTMVAAHATLIVQLYNDPQDESGSLAHLLYWGLTLMVLVNIIGYVGGLRNSIHAISDRISLPFAQGLYSMASTVAILNLLIIGKVLKEKPQVYGIVLYALQFLLNLFLMVGFNSRLSMLTFLLVAGLLVLKLWRPYLLIYVVSLLTLPLLLSFSELIYEIVQLPVFSEILKRVSYEDITNFNGRRYLWESGIDWFLTQGEGFWWGNGYRGYYTIDLFPELSASWDKSALDVHPHSTMLTNLVANGFLGTLPLLFILWICLKHYVNQYRYQLPNASLLGVILYLLFILEIDSYVYVESLGFLLLFMLSADVIVRRRVAYPSKTAQPV